MTNRTFRQFGFVFLMAVLAQGVRSFFKGVDFGRHSRVFGVMAGLAFFDFLSLNIGNPFPIGTFAMMTGLAFQSGLVLTMGELSGFRLTRWINGRSYNFV